jgi:RNA polymerase sigma-70 factor (ECF subfamily)
MHTKHLFIDKTKLIEALKNKNKEAQKLFYEQHHKQILGVCYRYFFNEEDAVECMNDVFITVFEKIHQYKAEGPIEGWYRRIAVNICINKLKKELKRKKLFIEEKEREFYQLSDTTNDDSVIQKDIPQQIILNMLQELPPASRTVFNLFAIDGLTHKDIATKMGISEGTSKWHLNNARKMLQVKIKSYWAQNNNEQNIFKLK